MERRHRWQPKSVFPTQIRCALTDCCCGPVNACQVLCPCTRRLANVGRGLGFMSHPEEMYDSDSGRQLLGSMHTCIRVSDGQAEVKHLLCLIHCCLSLLQGCRLLFISFLNVPATALLTETLLSQERCISTRSDHWTGSVNVLVLI